MFGAVFLLLFYAGMAGVDRMDVETAGEEVTPIVREVISEIPEPSVEPDKDYGLEIDLLSCTNQCTDCIHFPVNKQNELLSTYVPAVEKLNVSGGGNLVPEAKLELENMFNDAKSQDINMTVVSSYRSYTTQANLFESYVQTEMGRNGGNRLSATETANIYSAKAGHSEHQLGTTVDISCTGCTAFSNSEGNLKVYEYLRTNAYKFGFAISYTEQNKHITNYKAEPWHIRYLGKDYALEYLSMYNKLNGNLSIDKYLSDKCPSL